MRLERLADAAGYWVQNIRVRIDARGEAPHDVVHRIDIHIRIYGDREPHSLITRKNRGQKIPLPTFFDFVPLLDLYNTAAPVGHAERNVHILNDAGLQPLA